MARSFLTPDLFKTKQPKSNLFVHCGGKLVICISQCMDGSLLEACRFTSMSLYIVLTSFLLNLGPGALSDCVDLLGGSFILGDDNEANYNVISVDQRGMGRSEPSLIQDECTFGKKEDGNYTSPFNKLNPSDPDSIETYLEAVKGRVSSCFTCKDCGFNLKQKQEDGEIREFHFLECK